jgi:hypothetical protein
MNLQYINVRLLVSFTLPDLFINMDFVTCIFKK